MDVKAGATVGFAAAAGALAGAVFGTLVGAVLDEPSEKISTYMAGTGGLLGAFFGGMMVAPTPPSTAPQLPVAAAPPASMTVAPGSTTSRA
jgi:hypothetical protein